MTTPDFRYYQLYNQHDADTIFPLVYDQTGTKILWDGSTSAGNAINPGSNQKFDFNSIGGVIKNQTVVLLGAKVQGSNLEVKDADNPRKYINTSQKTAVGTFQQNETVHLSPAASSVDLDSVAFQDAYFKLSNPAVAKLLIAVAGLISPPEIVV